MITQLIKRKNTLKKKKHQKINRTCSLLTHTYIEGLYWATERVYLPEKSVSYLLKKNDDD